MPATESECAGYQFEAVKLSMRQDKTGCVLVLSIHPADADPNMFGDWVGSRYQVVMVRIGDDESVVKVKTRPEGEKSVALAGELCRQPGFQKWMVGKGLSFEKSEGSCADSLREYLGIETRSALKSNPDARLKLAALYEDYTRDS